MGSCFRAMVVSFSLIKSPFWTERLCVTPCLEKANPFLLGVLCSSDIKELRQEVENNPVLLFQLSFHFILDYSLLIPVFSLGCCMRQTHSRFLIPADPLRCGAAHDRVWQACVWRPLKTHQNKTESVLLPSVLLWTRGHSIALLLPGAPLPLTGVILTGIWPNSWFHNETLTNHQLNSLTIHAGTHTRTHSTLQEQDLQMSAWRLISHTDPWGQWCQRNYFWKELWSGSEQSRPTIMSSSWRSQLLSS